MGDRITETWVFGGVRIGSDRRKHHCWVADPDGERKHRLFEPFKGAMPVVGCEYRVGVERHDNDRVTLYNDKEFVGPHADDDFRAELEAKHRAADTRLRVKALEASEKRRSALDDTLAPLLRIAAKLPAPERDAFALYVHGRVRSAPYLAKD